MDPAYGKPPHSEDIPSTPVTEKPQWCQSPVNGGGCMEHMEVVCRFRI